MESHSKIYVAGHRGLVGSALIRHLQACGYTNLITRTHAELDLTCQEAVDAFFAVEKPDYVFLAAAKVGGIHANNTVPAEFLRNNLLIQTNVIHASYVNGVRRLLFLGSSCIYPKLALQPIKESYLLSGELEPTNRSYALAKIAGIEQCWAYNRQYKTQFLAVMPTNLYGPGDNYNPETSHVIPALIRRFHEAKIAGDPSVTIWGTGSPRREFLYSEDMVEACVYLINLPEDAFVSLLHPEADGIKAPLINIGSGHDMTIKELAEAIQATVGYLGSIKFDTSKPDGTPRKLLDVKRITDIGWQPTTSLEAGLRLAYLDFKKTL